MCISIWYAPQWYKNMNWYIYLIFTFYRDMYVQYNMEFKVTWKTLSDTAHIMSFYDIALLTLTSTWWCLCCCNTFLKCGIAETLMLHILFQIAWGYYKSNLKKSAIYVSSVKISQHIANEESNFIISRFLFSWKLKPPYERAKYFNKEMFKNVNIILPLT